MARIALNDATIADSTANDHITYSVEEYQGESAPYCVLWDNFGNCIRYNSDPIYSPVDKKTSATIKGKTVSTVTNVTIQGKAPIVQGDRTTENDSYNIPSGGTYVSGSHTSAQGSVTVGNSNNVYINGKSVAIENSTITTHARTSSKINGGTSSTVTIGS